MGDVVFLNEKNPKRKTLRFWWEDIVDDFDVWGNELVAHHSGLMWDVDPKALISTSDADIHRSEKIRGVLVPPMCRVGLLRKVKLPPRWKGDAEYGPLRFNGYVPLLREVTLPWHCPDELRRKY